MMFAQRYLEKDTYTILVIKHIEISIRVSETGILHLKVNSARYFFKAT